MKNRVATLALMGGLILLLVLPAAAYSRLQPPRAPLPTAEAEEPRFAGGPAGRSRHRLPFRAGGGRNFSLHARSGLAAKALAGAEQIGLTAEQREQIQDAQRAHREGSINRRAAMQIAALDLRELLRPDAPDVAAVEAKLRELAEARVAEQTDGLRLDASVREILDAEQLDQIEELALERGRSRRDLRGDRRERRNAR